MKQIIGVFIILTVLVLSGYYLIGRWAVNALDEESNRYKVLLDEKVIKDGDTLTIIDYSMIHNNVSLNDGTVMNIDLVSKRLLKEVK